MEKKTAILILLLLCFFIPFVSSESITYYKVPPTVYLDQTITATGLFVPDNNVYANKLCSFYFLDSNNYLVTQVTDYYTNATGRFAMPPFKITEPLFKRDNNYLVLSVCGTAQASSLFTVTQRESIARPLSQEFEFITNPSNTDTLFIWGTFIFIALVILFIGSFVWSKFKK